MADPERPPYDPEWDAARLSIDRAGRHELADHAAAGRDCGGEHRAPSSSIPRRSSTGRCPSRSRCPTRRRGGPRERGLFARRRTIVSIKRISLSLAAALAALLLTSSASAHVLLTNSSTDHLRALFGNQRWMMLPAQQGNEPAIKATPRADCRPGGKPEPAIQGRMPRAEVDAGRAAGLPVQHRDAQPHRQHGRLSRAPLRGPATGTSAVTTTRRSSSRPTR
jgi:hypothetical protein